jgi:hypothetical protein
MNSTTLTLPSMYANYDTHPAINVRQLRHSPCHQCTPTTTLTLPSMYANYDTHPAINVGQVSTQHDGANFADHLPACERRPSSLGKAHGTGQGPASLHVHLYVSVRLLGQVEDASRVCVQSGLDVLKCNIMKKLSNFVVSSNWFHFHFICKINFIHTTIPRNIMTRILQGLSTESSQS